MQTKIKANSALENEESLNAARRKRKCGRQISNAYFEQKNSKTAVGEEKGADPY
jgi:hypothetical protein